MQHKPLIHTRRLRIEPLEDRRMLATIVVNSLADNTEADGLITLREAILAANTDTVADAVEGVQAGSGGDVIEFDPVLFEGEAQTILLTEGELHISDSLHIIGPGAELLTIDASGNDPTPEEDNGDGSRVFKILGGENVSLSQMLLTGGDMPGRGGAILNQSNANLSINDATIVGNSATHGGGIATSTLTLINSVVAENAAILSGGGIDVLSNSLTVVSVLGSFLRDNSARVGGGIFNQIGKTLIVESTIFRNVANSAGGVGSGPGVVTVVSSMISRNSAERDGGISAGSVEVFHSTITGNVATVSTGGGVSAGSLIVTNSIIAENLASGGNPDANISTGMVTANYSLIGDTTGSHIDNNTGTGNILDQSALLGPLTNNGGPTPTHALLPGSPALNMGDPAAMAGVDETPEFDQRGAPWTRVYGGRIDMGAFEAQPNPLSGDYNFDGVVDAADQTVWRDTLGSTTDLRADGDGSGVVDELDYDVWVSGFGSVFEDEAEAVGAASVEASPSVELLPPPRTGEGDVRSHGSTSRLAGGGDFSNHRNTLLLLALGIPDDTTDESDTLPRTRQEKESPRNETALDLALAEWSVL